MKNNQFDPHTSFIDLPIFRKTIYLSFTLAGIVLGTIAWFSSLSTNLSFEGFNHALTVFKFPLGILGLTIPVIALLAANHRSEQTREQMRLAAENNNFSNYFKHFSEFQSHIERGKKFAKHIQISNTRNLHIKLFPNSKNGNYHASDLEIEKLDMTIVEYIEKCESIFTLQDMYKSSSDAHKKSPDSKRHEEEAEHLKNKITIALSKLSDSLNSYFKSLSLTQDNDENSPKLLPLKKEAAPQSRLLAIKQCISIISQALEFDENYKQSEKVKTLLDFDTTSEVSPFAIERLFLAHFKEKLEAPNLNREGLSS